LTAIKLHIGAQAKAEGWTTFDMKPGPQVDHVGIYSDLSAFSSNSADVIYACHVLQRIPFQSIGVTLKEWFRVLRPGGEILLSIPDMRLLCWQFLRDDGDLSTRFQIMRMLFGAQTDEINFSFSGLTFEFVQVLLREAGFESISRVESLGIFEDASNLTFRGATVNLNVRAYKAPAPPPRHVNGPGEISFGVMQAQLQDMAVLRNVARIGSVKSIVDLGCADGHFSLGHFELFNRPKIVNVDANPRYESSLKAIAESTQGHYVIAAITDEDGETEITEGAHSYWDSVRPPTDEYWKTVNNLTIGTRRVRSVTLDSLAREFSLPRPYLLKLDIQGAEEMALKGGKEFLRHTSVIICEILVHDFARIHRALDEADFALYDMIFVSRDSDGRLSWFYPIYLPRRHAAFTERGIWGQHANAEMVESQNERRRKLLEMNEALLQKYRMPDPDRQ